MKPPPVPDREPVAGDEERFPMRRARELVPRRFHCCCFSCCHSFHYALGRELLCGRPRTSGVQATPGLRAASLRNVGRGGAAGFRDFLRLPSAKENRSNRRAPLVPPTRLTPRIVEGWGKPRPAGAGLF